MSFLDRARYGLANYKNVDVRHNRGFLGHVVERGEYLGAAYLAGRINTQFADRGWAKIRGQDTTYVAGVGGMLLTFLADIMGYGGYGLLPHVNTVSTALVGAHFAAMGAQHGMAGSGRQLSLSPGRTAPTRRVAGAEMLGAIPPAPQPGRYLDLNEVSRLASMHG